MGLSDLKMKELKALLMTHDQKALQLKKDHREGRSTAELEDQMKLKLNRK